MRWVLASALSGRRRYRFRGSPDAGGPGGARYGPPMIKPPSAPPSSPASPSRAPRPSRAPTASSSSTAATSRSRSPTAPARSSSPTAAAGTRRPRPTTARSPPSTTSTRSSSWPRTGASCARSRRRRASRRRTAARSPASRSNLSFSPDGHEDRLRVRRAALPAGLDVRHVQRSTFYTHVDSDTGDAGRDLRQPVRRLATRSGSTTTGRSSSAAPTSTSTSTPLDAGDYNYALWFSEDGGRRPQRRRAEPQRRPPRRCSRATARTRRWRSSAARRRPMPEQACASTEHGRRLRTTRRGRPTPPRSPSGRASGIEVIRFTEFAPRHVRRRAGSSVVIHPGAHAPRLGPGRAGHRALRPRAGRSSGRRRGRRRRPGRAADAAPVVASRAVRREEAALPRHAEGRLHRDRRRRLRGGRVGQGRPQDLRVEGRAQAGRRRPEGHAEGDVLEEGRRAASARRCKRGAKPKATGEADRAGRDRDARDHAHASSARRGAAPPRSGARRAASGRSPSRALRRERGDAGAVRPAAAEEAPRRAAARLNSQWTSASHVKPMPPCSWIAARGRRAARVRRPRLGDRRRAGQLRRVGVGRPRREVRRRAAALGVEQHLRRLVLHGLERADRHAELLALLDVLDGHVERALRDADELGADTATSARSSAAADVARRARSPPARHAAVAAGRVDRVDRLDRAALDERRGARRRRRRARRRRRPRRRARARRAVAQRAERAARLAAGAASAATSTAARPSPRARCASAASTRAEERHGRAGVARAPRAARASSTIPSPWPPCSSAHRDARPARARPAPSTARRRSVPASAFVAHLLPRRARREQVARGALDLLLVVGQRGTASRRPPTGPRGAGRARARRRCSSGSRSCRPRSCCRGRAAARRPTGCPRSARPAPTMSGASWVEHLVRLAPQPLDERALGPRLAVLLDHAQPAVRRQAQDLGADVQLAELVGDARVVERAVRAAPRRRACRAAGAGGPGGRSRGRRARS